MIQRRIRYMAGIRRCTCDVRVTEQKGTLPVWRSIGTYYLSLKPKQKNRINKRVQQFKRCENFFLPYLFLVTFKKH